MNNAETLINKLKLKNNNDIEIIANNENKIKWLYKNNVYTLIKNDKTFKKICKRIKIVQIRFPKLAPDIISVNKKMKFIITKKYIPLSNSQKIFITLYITMIFICYEFFIPDILFMSRNIMHEGNQPKIIDFDGSSKNLYHYLEQNNVNKLLSKLLVCFVLCYTIFVKKCIKSKRKVKILLNKQSKKIKKYYKKVFFNFFVYYHL